MADDLLRKRFDFSHSCAMRVLVYGFGPYRYFQENVTKKILRQLPKQKHLKKVIFPVKFHQGQFTHAIKKFNPDVILGLGQCSRGRLLRIEARAVNKRRNERKEKTRPIVPSGSRMLLTNLRFNLGPAGRPSNNAGDYVCNYSMYVILHFLKRRRLPIPFGFIHIPCRYDERKAARLLVKAIAEMRAAE